MRVDKWTRDGITVYALRLDVAGRAAGISVAFTEQDERWMRAYRLRRARAELRAIARHIEQGHALPREKASG